MVAHGTNSTLEAAAPGARNKFIAPTACKCGVDTVLVDSNPHRGKLNTHIILTSDFHSVRCAPETYSQSAIKAFPATLQQTTDTCSSSGSGSNSNILLNVPALLCFLAWCDRSSLLPVLCQIRGGSTGCTYISALSQTLYGRTNENESLIKQQNSQILRVGSQANMKIDIPGIEPYCKSFRKLRSESNHI